MEAPKEITGWALVTEAVVKYGIFLFLFIFSLFAKWFTMIRYRKRMTKFQCVFETLLCGFGGSVLTYMVFKMGAPEWVVCGVGGFGSLAITPLTTVITKEAQPTFQMIVITFQKIIKKKES